MIGTFVLAAIVFCGSLTVLRSKLTLQINLLFAATKSLTFLLYFSIFSQELPFTGLDDVNYLLDGRAICHALSQSNVFSAFFIATFSISNGKHILYPIFNCLTSLLPTDHYQTSVAINAIIASFCTFIFLDIFQFIGGFKSKNDFKVYAIFISFIPEFWVWTTLLNFKEAILCSVFAYVYRNVMLRRTSEWLIVILFLIALYFLRYYSLVFFIPSFAIVYLWPGFVRLLQGKITNLNLTVLILISLFMLVFSNYIARYIYDGLFIINIMFVPDIFGIVRFLITPLPINITAESAYLFLFSAIQPMLLCLYIFGIFTMINSRDMNKIAIVMMSFTIIVFYGSLPELAGPRQRLIVSNFNYIIMAFGLQYIIKEVRRFGAIHNNIT